MSRTSRRPKVRELPRMPHVRDFPADARRVDIRTSDVRSFPRHMVAVCDASDERVAHFASGTGVDDHRTAERLANYVQCFEQRRFRQIQPATGTG